MIKTISPKQAYSKGDRFFIFFDWILLFLLLIIILYPLLYIISASFTAGTTVMSLSLIPQKVSLVGYKTVFQFKDIWTGYANSLFYMAAGTSISLMLTIFCAYPLSRSDFKGANVVMVLCMITM